MSFDNDTNHGRVEKILGLLDLIDKSAQSNNASEEDVVAMLRPLLDRIGIPTGASQEAPEPATKVRRPEHIALWEAARDAPLDQIMMAWSTINSRLMDLVDEYK